MKLPRIGRGKQPVRRAHIPERGDGYTFRRSRTLTGTVSNQVTPAATKEQQLKTARTRAHELHHRRKHLLRYLMLTIVAAVGVLVLLWQFIGNDAVRVQAGTTKPVDARVYEQAIRGYFSSRPLEQFGFSYNAENLQRAVIAKHPEVRQVSLGNHEFTVELRQPLLVWRAGGKTMYVDRDGVLFDRNAFNEPALSVTDNSGIQASNGVVASSRFIRFLGQLVGAVNAYNMGNVEQIVLPSGTTRQLDIKLAGRPYTIKTNFDRDPLAQAEDIKNAIVFLEGKGVTPGYIDARVAGKAFYQ